MRIQIIDEITDEQDRKILQLLEKNNKFEERVREIRNRFSIPNDGMDNETLEFIEGYLKDENGKQIKLNKPSKFVSTSDENYIRAFNSNPSIGLCNNGEFERDIEALCSEFNLGERWFQAISFIVLTSTADWLHRAIECYPETVAYKSDLITTGVVLRINENISKKQIVRWLNLNWDKYRNQMSTGLKIYKRKLIPRTKYFDLTKEIIDMRDKDKLTFSEISEILSNKYAGSEVSDIVVDEKSIEKRYYRSQKLLGQNALRGRHNK